MKHWVRGCITSDDYGVIRAIVLNGGGIARLPRLMVADDLRGGRLVRVLPDYDSVTRSLHYVHASARNVAPKIEIFRQLVIGDLTRRELAWRVLDKAQSRRPKAK